jgi:hypothetical protein
MDQTETLSLLDRTEAVKKADALLFVVIVHGFLAENLRLYGSAIRHWIGLTKLAHDSLGRSVIRRFH